MTTEDLHALFAPHRVLTAAEVNEAVIAVRQSPALARAMWEICLSMSAHDEFATMVMSLSLAPLILSILNERIATDDGFALTASETLFAMMHRLTHRAESSLSCAKMA